MKHPKTSGEDVARRRIYRTGRQRLKQAPVYFRASWEKDEDKNTMFFIKPEMRMSDQRKSRYHYSELPVTIFDPGRLVRDDVQPTIVLINGGQNSS